MSDQNPVLALLFLTRTNGAKGTAETSSSTMEPRLVGTS
jgi:hypothetical protein